jgi:hypothetical protein
LDKYSSLIAGLKQQIITMMGQQDSMSLMRNNFVFTIYWTMLFIVFFAYFFVTASIVAFEDGFDETVKEKGYPSDFEKASMWSANEYLIWALSWLPSDKLERVKKAVSYKDDGKAEEETKEEDEGAKKNEKE